MFDFFMSLCVDKINILILKMNYNIWLCLIVVCKSTAILRAKSKYIKYISEFKLNKSLTFY